MLYLLSYHGGLKNVQKFARYSRIESYSLRRQRSEKIYVDVTETPSFNQIYDDNSNENKGEYVDKCVWRPIPNIRFGNFSSILKKLSKFRLTSLVVITAMSGYAMAPGPFQLYQFMACSLGTGLVSAAANAINQYHEVPFDSQMSRTKNRLLVRGQLTPLHSVEFAFVSATAGLCLLYFGVNVLTAILGATNLLLYTSIYTPLKRMSILNTWIGSLVGAIPPLIGWTGCSGNLDEGALILAGMLFAWQFPHFNALSWNLRPDYSRAGYRMMAVTNPVLCRRTALRYTIIIALLSASAPFFDVTSSWFVLESFPFNAYFCFLAFKFYRKSNSNTSRALFRYSLLHLPCLMLLLLMNKKRWLTTEKKSSAVDIHAKESHSNSIRNRTVTLHGRCFVIHCFICLV
ncbi:protoheme IX farnesyltransferase, mitochondrial-like isoform X4 [Eurosta solidaginis]|uniref:protoheme IX farnesyltransferase, mitochondrial-like isoform X4 n=1 Tax=Eurosta solidaginis TaxID=178769 RepID=UPI0035316417